MLQIHFRYSYSKNNYFIKYYLSIVLQGEISETTHGIFLNFQSN